MDLNKTLHLAIDLSDQILASIELQELDKISVLEKERENLMSQYFKNTDIIDKKLTLLLKQKNDQIVFQLVELQQQTRVQQMKLKQSQKVSKAYLDNL